MKNGRKAWVEVMNELMEKDKKVFLIYMDVGFSYMDDLLKKYPNQCLNAGIGEQSAMGIATGLAFGGFKVYVYTMINFIVFRPYEQVRNDICYQNANVKLFGVEGSAAYQFLGFSHNISENEDKKLLDHLPNLNLYFPQTEEEVKTKMLEEYNRPGPAYFRI